MPVIGNHVHLLSPLQVAESVRVAAPKVEADVERD